MNSSTKTHQQSPKSSSPPHQAALQHQQYYHSPRPQHNGHQSYSHQTSQPHYHHQQQQQQPLQQKPLIESSPVLHLRSVPPQTKEDDLRKFIGEMGYGQCTSVRLLDKQQALVEMGSVEIASKILSHSNRSTLTLWGRPIQISYSRSKNINQSSGHVIKVLFESTGSNGHSGLSNGSSITLDFLYSHFSRFGAVLRIVIFYKNSLNALVEFSTPDGANSAKKNCNNQTIRGGSLVLRVEISKTEKLNVTQNTDKSRDFSKPIPSFPTIPTANGNSPTNSNNNTVVQTNQTGGYNNHNNNNNNNNGEHSTYRSSQSHQYSPSSHRTPVLLVHGLDNRMMTCEKIYNLFSVYGNVQKVKLINGKKAMVQMDDSIQAEHVLRFYHQIQLFGELLMISYSKHFTLTDSHNPESTTISKDFSYSPLNRFTHSIGTYKHIYKPSNTLYFSNVPKDYTELTFQQLFHSLKTPCFTHMKIFTLPNNSNNTNNNSPNGNNINSPETKHNDKIVGLLEFATIPEALEALVSVNNYQPPNSNQTIRLSFSNSSVVPKSFNGVPTHSPTNSTTTNSTTSPISKHNTLH